MRPENNWYVITGGPCAGKTSVVEVLKEKGYKVQYEMARVFIDEEMVKGKTIEEIRGNEQSFQRKILRMKVEIENKLLKNELIIFDRGIPDSLAYYIISGIPESDPELTEALKRSNYKKIFFLELLDFQEDYARTDQEKAVEIHEKLKESYERLGIPIIEVPKMTTKFERADFIIKNL